MSKQSASALSNLDIFRGLSKSELNKVAKLTTPSTIAAGKEFITEGSTGREAYIITSGTASVKRGGRLVASVGPGDVLGEMAVAAGLHRTASVTAVTDLEVEVLSRSEFISLLDQVPSIARKMLAGALTRLHELEPSLG